MKTKICTKCLVDKEIHEFNRDTTKPDGYYSSCKTCRSIQSKIYSANNQHVIKRRQHFNKDYVYDILSQSKCAVCGEDNIMYLDFDHIDPKEKTAAVSDMFGWSIENIAKEIKKCNILCSHCHRDKTAKEFNWYILEYIEKKRKTNGQST